MNDWQQDDPVPPAGPPAPDRGAWPSEALEARPFGPPAPPRAELTPLHGFAALLASVPLGLALSVAAMLPFAVASADPSTLAANPWALLAAAMAMQAAMLGVVGLTLSLARLPWHPTLALWPLPWWQGVLAAVGMVAAGVAGDALAGWLHRLMPDAPSLLDHAAAIFAGLSGPALWGVAALFALVPAVVEETLFRGLLYRSFAGRWGAAGAVVATALLFGLIHWDLFQSPAAFVLGLYLGALRARSGSVYAPMAAHAANNAVAVFVMASHGAGVVAGMAPTPPVLLGGVLLGLLCLAAVRGEER